MTQPADTVNPDDTNHSRMSAASPSPARKTGPPSPPSSRTPKQSPSPSNRKSLSGKSRSPSGKSRSLSGKSRSPSGKSQSSSGKKSPGRKKSPSPSRTSSSGKAKSGSPTSRTKSPKQESSGTSGTSASTKKKNVVIKSPELTERGLKILDFSGQGMTAIPASLLSSKDVGVLILASNNLRSLPLEMRRMKSLIKLDISRNGIRCVHPGDFSGLPQELESLTDLEELRIAECNLPYVPPAIWRLKKLKVLDISRNKINILPPEIGNLTELKRLNLQQTNITSLPPEIAYCQELEEILLWGNSIENLPDTLPEMPKLRVLALNYRSFCGVVDPYMENLLRKRQINSEHIPVVVFELPALEVLDLESTKVNNLPDVYNISLKELYLCQNFLQSVPSSVYNLKYLQVLDMSHNMLNILPDDVGCLRTLRILRVNNNCFESVPATIGLLENLTELNMAKNRIRHLPTEIRGLCNLKTLILEGNDLQSLPDEICELTNLETLDLTSNSIRILPMKLFKLTKLQEAHGYCKLSKYGLWLYRNPMEQPPPEIWRTEKTENIFQYLKRLLIMKTENLQRQKIMMLGNSQAGKTSLAYVLAKGKASLTEGLTDRTCLLKLTPYKTENNVPFVLLDFGGDDAYEPIYHLFLDSKALALIVYDAHTFREESFYHMIGRWLDMLNCYTPGTVVKIVGTQCDHLCAQNSSKEMAGQQEAVCQMVKHHLQDYRKHLLAELESIKLELAAFDKPNENGSELGTVQEAALRMLHTRQDRLNDILSCPLRVLPTVSAVSASDSLQGIRQLTSELEHTAIDRTLFAHAQRKVPQHWNRLKDTLKQQSSNYLPWARVQKIAAGFDVRSTELDDCVQHFCDTGEVLWFRKIPALSHILFHRPRILVDLAASLYRHDICDFLQYPDNKVFYSKGRLRPEAFSETKELFLQYGQISRPLLSSLWFQLKMDNDTLEDFLKLLPLTHLCYTVPETDVPAVPLHQRPLMVLPHYNKDIDLTPLLEVWPEVVPTNEKNLRVMYHFPIIFPVGVLHQVSASIQDMVMMRMDWKDVIYATTETAKCLIRKCLEVSKNTGALVIAVRSTDFAAMQELMKDLMELVTRVLTQYPGVYWKVEVPGSTTTMLLKHA